MEKVITCPVCLDVDHCFEEVQETFSSYLCFNCGFMSDSRYEIGSLKLADNLKKSPTVAKLKSKYFCSGLTTSWENEVSTDCSNFALSNTVLFNFILAI